MLQSGIFEVEVVQDVPYGNARGYWCTSSVRDDNFVAMALQFPKAWSERDLTLALDVYRPAGTGELMPLVMLMHGGAFFANSKSSMPVSRLCYDLAAAGFVAVSIDYRMGFNLNKKSVSAAAERALEDAGVALRFLKDNASSYGIDTSRIIIGGSSSGAITTMKLAAGERAHHIIGIIDMWGGVEDISLLDDCPAALLAIHGDRDKTVPFTEGWPLGGKKFNNYMYGSRPLVEHLLSMGKDARLVVLEGYAHAPYRDKNHSVNSNYDIIKDEIIRFVGKLINLRK